MLVGNNKNLWRMFLEACARAPGLLRAEDPLDAYVEGEVQAAAQATGYGAWSCSKRLLPVMPAVPGALLLPRRSKPAS